MQKVGLFVLLTIFMIGLTSCSPGVGSSATATLSSYLKALVDKDENTMTSLVCPNWQTDALVELDAFQASKTQLEGLACRQAGSENNAVLINCQGKILASYSGATQTFDLSNRIYRLEKNGTDWQVCGYTMK